MRQHPAGVARYPGSVRQVFERDEFNALFADLDAPTDDDVSITTDGRRLDSVEAVMAFVEEVARERVTAERER